jgi:hypothetical protein
LLDNTLNGSNVAQTISLTGAGTQGSAIVSITNLTPTYSGSPLSVTVTTNPSGQPVTVTYNGSTTAPTNVGSYLVIATISGGNYTGSSETSMSIEPASQIITFPAIAAQTVGASVALKATSTSNLTVAFQSATPSDCSVTGTTAKMLAAGTCTIVASQSGNNNYITANVAVENITVNTAPAAGFKLVATPGSETIQRGVLAAFLLEAQSVNSFSGSVKITCSGGPSNSVCGSFPQTLKVSANKTALALSGILFPKNTAPGTYTLTFTGISGTTTASTIAKFTVTQ